VSAYIVHSAQCTVQRCVEWVGFVVPFVLYQAALGSSPLFSLIIITDIHDWALAFARC